MTRPFQVRVRHSSPVTIIDLIGDLSHASEEPLLTAIHGLAVQPHVLLNFQGVGYINSAGISLLVSLLSEDLSRDRKWMACHLSPHYEKIFRMVGLSSFIPTFSTEEAALNSVSRRR
jgi:anti-anti-sigma factor